MSIRESNAARALAALLALASAGAAAAQPQPRPAQPPAPAAPATNHEPQRTTATYGDWVVRCEIPATPPAKKTCDMEQVAQGQTGPISRVAISPPGKGESIKLFVQLPVNVSFAAPLRITADAKDAGVTTPFRRCIPAGCFAELELKDELQKKFRASAAPGKIIFRDAGDHEVAIPVSFKGFAQAYEALSKQ